MDNKNLFHEARHNYRKSASGGLARWKTYDYGGRFERAFESSYRAKEPEVGRVLCDSVVSARRVYAFGRYLSKQLRCAAWLRNMRAARTVL